MRLVHYAAGYRQRRHSHSHHGISFLIAGSLREQVRRREETAAPFSLVIKPAEVSHTDWVGPEGARLLQIKFDADNRLWHESGIDGHDNWRWMHNGPGLRQMVALLARLQSTSGAPTTSIEEAVIDLLAELTRTEEPGRDAAPAWLRPIKEQLDDAAEESLCVQRLAELAGVHAVSLSRAFRRHNGVSVAQYRKLARFRRAIAALTGSSHNLCEVAHACGYTDHSHFCRDLRTLAGVSPGAIRDLASRVSFVQEK
ncbi:helix-turn-helix domain-containing protein [Microbulbifer halophilus]|uniref:Helix-turn-helix domain-containing protein n=1 Tax=Microbulbifer halophilus TaxID=453963 RepID=A0ABW5E6A4_9GAMM|nr:AraC family transcriptional regulator [Microbulbifer halophilus]MCW8127463.1 AraC family transcriptional regulator [Microbulbifer halophilus]